MFLSESQVRHSTLYTLHTHTVTSWYVDRTKRCRALNVIFAWNVCASIWICNNNELIMKRTQWTKTKDSYQNYERSVPFCNALVLALTLNYLQIAHSFCTGNVWDATAVWTAHCTHLIKMQEVFICMRYVKGSVLSWGAKCHENILKKQKKIAENMNANEKNVELNELQMNRDIRDRKMTMTWFGSGVCTYTWNNVKSTKICECATKMVVLFKNYVLLNCITIKWSARCFVIYIRVQLMLTLKYICI